MKPVSSLNNFPQSHAFITQLEHEFPGFGIRRKRDDALQKLIGQLLFIVTVGGQRSYLSHYHTALFGKLWVPDSWDAMRDVDRYILLRHERIHLLQRKRMGEFLMGAYYLLWIFPLGLAYGRARIEWEAYEETIRATYETYGEERARDLKSEIVQRFVGPDYGWMWPFPTTVGRWFDQTLHAIRIELDAK